MGILIEYFKVNREFFTPNIPTYHFPLLTTTALYVGGRNNCCLQNVLYKVLTDAYVALKFVNNKIKIKIKKNLKTVMMFYKLYYTATRQFIIAVDDMK